MFIRPLAPNQAELHINDTSILFSYETPVAARINGKYYRTSVKYSTTTTRHINAWLHGAEVTTMPQEFFNNLVETKGQ